MSEFTAMQLDFLKEVGNLGIGNAATALSKMTDKQVDISLPYLKVKTFNDLFFDVNTGVSASIMKVSGDLFGYILLICSKDEERNLLNHILHMDRDNESLDELDQSAFNETANIICTTYLNSLSELFKITLLAEPPMFFTGAVDTVSVYVKEILKTMELSQIVSVNTDLFIGQDKVSSNIFLIFDDPSLFKLLDLLNKQMGL